VNQKAIDAMEALFAFAEAMESEVSVGDLIDVMRMAIETGHDQFQICLAMALVAIKECQKVEAVPS
jgi:hypothetical protein